VRERTKPSSVSLIGSDSQTLQREVTDTGRRALWSDGPCLMASRRSRGGSEESVAREWGLRRDRDGKNFAPEIDRAFSKRIRP